MALVAVDGQLKLGPPRRRAVLALLVVNIGKVVPVSSIIRNIWGTEPPNQAVATLQSYVSRLRKLIAGRLLAGGVQPNLEYRSPGYVLDAAPDHVPRPLWPLLAPDPDGDPSVEGPARL